MKKHLKNLLIRSFISTLAIGSLLPAITGLTHAAYNNPSYAIYPEITEVQAYSDPFNPDEDSAFTIKYCTNVQAEVTVGIYKETTGGRSQKVALLSDEARKSYGCYEETWNGEYDGRNEFDRDRGETVPKGQYFYGITVVAYSGSDYAAGFFQVDDEAGDDREFEIIDVDLENSTFDPYDNQEVEFTFTLNKAADVTLEIFEEGDNDEIVTILDEEPYSRGEHFISWDGRDRYNYQVDQDEYEYKFTAVTDNGEKETKRGSIRVKRGFEDDDTIDPRLKRAYVTKESFDPGSKEHEFFVFTLSSEANVKITVYDRTGREVAEVLDVQDREPGTYAVEWDGDEVIDKEGTYTYKVRAYNRRGSEELTGKIEVENDENKNRKPNVFGDRVTEIPYNPRHDEIGINFKLEADSIVTIEIRDRRTIATVIEEQELREGSHTIYWNGRDDYGDFAADGIYEYRIIAENDRGKDTEKGKFSVEGSTHAREDAPRCSQFDDVNVDYKYCEAIEWAASEGIFQGYYDGTFRPTQSISRAETVKVILSAFDLRILEENYHNLGFSDVDRYDWYMAYLETAVSLGIVNGYPDGTFKPHRTVNRAEALVIMLNTAKIADRIIVPTNVYGDPFYDTPNNAKTRWYVSFAWFAKLNNLTDNDHYFYPAQSMTRAEMADMLYRYHQNLNY